MIFGRDKHLRTFLESVITEKSSDNRGHIDDPTTIGFSLFFDFEGPDSPLFNESSGGESAIRYLKSIGETERADKLKRFKSNVQTLVQEYPYFFRTLNGLESISKAWKGRGFKEDVFLKIKTHESIDLRIGTIIEDYKAISFDINFIRDMLPDNLRWFKIYVILSEIRSFRTFAETVTVTSNTQTDEFGMVSLNEHLNAYIYKFYNCEFDFSESNGWFSELSMEKPESVGNTIGS